MNEAEKELMAAHEALGKAGIGLNSDGLFWLDPWSRQGQAVSAKLLPLARICVCTPSAPSCCSAEARHANPGLKKTVPAVPWTWARAA